VKCDTGVFVPQREEQTSLKDLSSVSTGK